jgi:hypothetical protein
LGDEVGNLYLLLRHRRSPASFFVDSILKPCFFPAVEMNPRTLWVCQPVAFMISASVAPVEPARIGSRSFDVSRTSGGIFPEKLG